MMKPLPRLLLIASLIGGGIFGLNHYLAAQPNLHPASLARVPQALDIATGPAQAPSAANTATATTGALQGLAPAQDNYQARVLVLPWNATAALHYANGDSKTASGSLMEKRGVRLQLERQDDYAQMLAEQLLFAGEVAKGVSNPAKGAAFVVIMGDGAPGYFASAQEGMQKLGQQLEIVGALGYSRGEDKCMLPRAVATDPQRARGSLIGAVLRDGDWNICMKYAADNKIPVNPDPATYDPEAMNFVAVTSFNEADEKLIAASRNGACETRPIVNNGKRTGERRKVCQNGSATWTPGDVKLAREVGGLAAVASTREYMWQMPATIIGNKEWMAKHPQFVQNLLAASFEASDLILHDDAKLLQAGSILAKVMKEQDGAWWAKYFKGVQETDKQGFPIALGGSTTSNLADNLFLFGLNGNDNLYKRVYSVFGNMAKTWYPQEMPNLIAAEQVVNPAYLQALAKLGHTGKANTPEFKADAAVASTFAKRAWAIEFETGQASFKPEAMPVLEELLNQLAVSGLALQISGHTDNVGNSNTNLQLSKKRADAVRAWLEANASSEFPAGRIRIRAFGDTQPLTDNRSADGRAHNRRVEIALLKTSADDK